MFGLFSRNGLPWQSKTTELDFCRRNINRYYESELP